NIGCEAVSALDHGAPPWKIEIPAEEDRRSGRPGRSGQPHYGAGGVGTSTGSWPDLLCPMHDGMMLEDIGVNAVQAVTGGRWLHERRPHSRRRSAGSAQPIAGSP